MTDIPPEESTAPTFERSRWDYLPRFVGTNAERYVSVAEALQNGKLGLGWSWPAFLFTECWLVYRRRFAWAVMFISFSLIASYVLGVDMGENVIFAARVLMAIFGKSLYLRDALRRIDRIIENSPDESTRGKRIDLAGGVDSNAVIVLFLLTIVAAAVTLWYGWPTYMHIIGQEPTP